QDKAEGIQIKPMGSAESLWTIIIIRRRSAIRGVLESQTWQRSYRDKRQRSGFFLWAHEELPISIINYCIGNKNSILYIIDVFLFCRSPPRPRGIKLLSKFFNLAYYMFLI
ncbi:hypothetical protein ACJX0J_017171, partial [Zea mays]